MVAPIFQVKIRQAAKTVGFLFGGMGQMIVYSVGSFVSYRLLQVGEYLNNNDITVVP